VTIDAYLAELERRLPRLTRRRALAEVREHLRDAASRHRSAGMSAPAAEAAATRAFGPPDDVARRFLAELVPRELRAAATLALGAVVFFVVPLYVVPENTLPPAPWLEKPRDLQVLQTVGIAFWAAAGLLALAAAVLAWTRLNRFVVPALTCASVALLASIVLDAALVVRWFSYTPATPGWALAAPFAAACLVVCGGGALWARASRRRIALQD
jgi:hypothetical protein